MKVILEHYQCDYCDIKSDEPDLKYTDNSGLNNKCYDMCSDDCLNKHIDFLKQTEYKYDGKDEDGYSIKQHLEEFIKTN